MTSSARPLPDIEPIVSSLLLKSNNTTPPVLLSGIAGLWKGLRISLEDIEGEAYAVDLGRQGGEILISEDSPRTRQRYSLAHEIGHFALREFGIPFSESGAANRNSTIERWCDRFAAEVLMPRKWIQDILSTIDENQILQTVLTLPSRFGVSTEALRIRICEISYLSLFEVAQADGERMIAKMYQSRLRPMDLGKVVPTVMRTLSASRGAMLRGDYTEGDLKIIYHTILKKHQTIRWLIGTHKAHLPIIPAREKDSTICDVIDRAKRTK